MPAMRRVCKFNNIGSSSESYEHAAEFVLPFVCSLRPSEPERALSGLATVKSTQ